MKAQQAREGGGDGRQRRMLRSKSLPHVDLKRFKLLKQASNSSQLSQDSTSEYKDSGIEGEAEVEPELDSLPSSSGIPPDFPSAGSEAGGACTCQGGGKGDHVKVIITDSGQPVLVKHMDQKLRELRTLKQHYYPEGGWGWLVTVVVVLVNMIAVGTQLALAVLLLIGGRQQGRDRSWEPVQAWLAALSPSVSLILSPLTVAFCRRKSTRLTGVVGGLLAALGCLFTSFATRLQQVFFSYGLVLGVGVGLVLDTSTLMLGQYFKRRREAVEVAVGAAGGLGIAVMFLFVEGSVRSIGWRLGLQATTGILLTTFILGTFYRSATLYHPQRRAILHLKTQKRKIKEKNKSQEDKPPFFDVSCLKSRTVQILLVSTALGALGTRTPLYYLAHHLLQEGMHEGEVLYLEAYLGLAWAVGVCLFGWLVVQHSGDCTIGRQYLCQASLLACGLSLLALTAVQGYHGYVTFTWVYGVFTGGYQYSLKMYVYQKVRARNFARAWGYIQASQAVPHLLGVSIAGYINVGWGGKTGYYFSACCVLLGSACLSLIDLHRRDLRRRRHRARHEQVARAESSCPPDTVSERESVGRPDRRLSFPEEEAPHLSHHGFLGPGDSLEDLEFLKKSDKELTHFSEEGIADMDIPDHLLEELDFLDNITSCDKVENYLMLSEYEQNLIKEIEGPEGVRGRRGRKWSLVRQGSSLQGDFWPLPGRFLQGGANRSIPTIEEGEG